MTSIKTIRNWKDLKNEFVAKYKPTQKIMCKSGGMILPFDDDGIIHGANLQKICEFVKAKGMLFFLTRRGIEIHE